MLRIILITAALLLPSAAIAQTVVTILEEVRVSIPEFAGPAPASHRLKLSVVHVEGSGWTREQAVAALREATAILGQCGIATDAVEWLSLSVPVRFLDFSTPVARELARLQPVRRPAIYLVRDTLHHPAFDAEAIGRGNSQGRPEIADTVWITAANAGTRDAGIVFAHELAHILMNSGEHSADPKNLMAERTAPGGTGLTATQCARMRETGSGNGLLAQP